MTWGQVFWRYVTRGHDRSDAAYRADEWERRTKSRCPAEKAGAMCTCQNAGITTGDDFVVPISPHIDGDRSDA